MDKQKVILAYRMGHITMQECAQILGVDSARVFQFMDEAQIHPTTANRPLEKKTVVN